MVDKAVESAKNWILNSGIQNPSGSFNAWYDAEEKKYSFEYSEITGYAITGLLNLGEIEKAKSAADWLIRHAYDEAGGFKCRHYPEEKKWLRVLCSFDNGICINGLVNLYRVTGESKYLENSRRIARWLIGTMQKLDGSVFAKLDLAKKARIDSADSWSKQSGSFHAKISVGLLNLADVTGEKDYEDSARRICDWTLVRQEDDGRFVTNRSIGDTYVHPHCYSVEGLLVAGIFLGEKRYIAGARKGIEWLSNAQMKNGLSCEYNGEFSPGIHADSLAQVIRLHTLMGNTTEKLAHNLVSLQCHSKDPRADGGFYYGVKNGSVVPHVNTHATLFVIQALTMRREGFDFYDLI